MTYLSENIFRLRSEGKTYKEIQDALGCSKGTISYHLGEGQKAKFKARRDKDRATLAGSITKKIYAFEKETVLPQKRTPPKRNLSNSQSFSNKIGDFSKQSRRVVERTFTYQDVIEKFSSNPVCYLTGDEIDINSPRSYHFDHIYPRSRGGTNTLDNLGLTTSEANKLKGNLTVEELLDLCEKVLRHYGRL